MLHSALHSLPPTLHTPDSTSYVTLCTLDPTLHTPTLFTPHCAPTRAYMLDSLHFTFTPYTTLNAPHIRPYTLRCTHTHTRSALHTPHLTLYILIPHSTLHSPHPTLHLTLYIPHSTRKQYSTSTYYSLHCTL